MFDYLRTVQRKLQKKLRPRRRKEVVVFDIDGDFDYLELAARCRTQNEFNRLHIGLENVCTPGELAEIAKLAKARKGLAATRSWLKNYQMWTPELFDAPQRFERRAISRHMILYQSPERDACDKDLLVAFADNARRLLMPVCVFLQFLDSPSWDVVVLKKCSRDSYLLGLEDTSVDFSGLIEFIQTTLSPMQYRRVITLGTSGGGFAAILAAHLMGAQRGISIGGSPPKLAQSPTIGKQRASHRTDFCFVFASESAVDHQSALALLGLFGGRLCPVPGTHRHNPIGPMMKNGQFGEFIDEILA
jgi:hypothetical protein